MTTHLPWLIGAAAALALVVPTSASAVTIDFEGGGSLVHGEVIDTDFAGSGVLAITTTNIGGGPDLGVIFDSGFGGATTDSDLLTPWDGGNLFGFDSGNMLIIQENATGCGDDVCDNPDDEGTRPAGSFEITFSSPQTSFGFDLIDVDGTSLENGSIVFYDGVSTFTIFWDDFEAGSGSTFEIADVVFGDNFANRIAPITSAEVGLTKFDKIVINMGGSGAIDTLTFVPEPATGVLLLLGLTAIAAHRRSA